MNPDPPDQAADAATIDDRHAFSSIAGTHEIPIGLDRAWSASKLGVGERRVLQYVREETWHSGAESCHFNVSRMSRLWRIARAQLHRQIKGLVEDGMLVRIDGDYSIGTDVWSWVSAGRLEAEDVMMAIVGHRNVHVPRPDESHGKEPISRSLRTMIHERDAYRCLCCGDHHGLEIDHIVPESLGGPTTPDNLQTLCRRCNGGKGTSTIDYRIKAEEDADGDD